MKISTQTQQRRDLFLLELRSGNYKKGTTKSDEKGHPVFDSEADKDGCCACAIMVHLFGQKNGKMSLPTAVKALGINSKHCLFIQQELNDTPLSFPEIAARIETEIFNR